MRIFKPWGAGGKFPHHGEELKEAAGFGCEEGSTAAVGSGPGVRAARAAAPRSCSRMTGEVARLENRNFRSRS